MDDSRIRLWQWRPASRAAVLGWWVATLAVTAVLAILVAAVVGVVAYAMRDRSQEFSDLGAVVVAIGALVLAGYVAVVVGAVVLAGRYVPPQRRGRAWTLTLGGVLVVATGLVVLGLLRSNQLVLATTGPILALVVPALVVTRVPETPATPERRAPSSSGRLSPPGPTAGPGAPRE